MKKVTKIILLVTALLTVALVITAITMLKIVSGDALLYMNSKLGSFYAHSYRWFCLASIVMVLFWVIFLIVKRKAIAGSIAKRKQKNQEEKKVEEKKVEEKKVEEKKVEEKEAEEKKAGERKESSPQKAPDGMEEDASQELQDKANGESSSVVQSEGKENTVQEKKSRFCINCGKQISGNDKFCGFCGGAVKVFDGPEPKASGSEEPSSLADAQEDILEPKDDFH